MSKRMKLYIWDDVLTDYTPGMMFALAPDIETAREMLLKKCDYLPKGDLAKTPKVHALNEELCRIIWGGS